ncbi:hypothetical protein N9414_18093 [Nodularia spumigena CCY9414]|nr:hypothetical protein N9414_18093 [Nodularia spumigena CCY9414]
MLQGLQPARKPIPGGMSWVKPSKQPASERPAPTKSEPVAFKCENLSMEALPIPESTDTTQEN